jgi:hypothetical protein
MDEFINDLTPDKSFQETAHLPQTLIVDNISLYMF